MFLACFSGLFSRVSRVFFGTFAHFLSRVLRCARTAACFDSFDLDGDQKLSLDELGLAFAQLGLVLATDDLQQVCCRFRRHFRLRFGHVLDALWLNVWLNGLRRSVENQIATVRDMCRYMSKAFRMRDFTDICMEIFCVSNKSGLYFTF